MAEYISKNRIYDLINAVNSVHGFTSYEDYVGLLKDVETSTNADAQPVRRGKWIEIAGYGGMCNTYYQCPFPECNTTESIPSNYCPNCGAELRGIDNE